jgi:Holliday junction DNA helicase RuvB
MSERTEVTTPEALSDDEQVEPSLRPQRLAEFIGQPKVCESLAIAVEAARARKEPLDHVLFHGPPGLGKTTLASLMAREMGVNIKTTSGPVLEKPADLVGILTNQRQGDILFIDEIHRLRPIIEEFLYPAMEDWQVDVGRSADILGVEATPEGADEIARRARGTPRVANRLLRRVRDFAEVRADGVIDQGVARAALEMLDVDEYGLDEMDARVLKTLIEKFEGGPVGLSSLAVAMGEDATTLEEVYEPFLIMEGFLMRTPQGRVATSRAFRRFGYTMPESLKGTQGSLFVVE